MNNDYEQHLRAEMEQVAVNPRPGLAHQAYRRYRGRRRMIRTAAAAGTAMAIAGTAVGVAAATSSPAAIPAQTTAYVASHVSRALATSDEISYTILSYDPQSNTQVVLYDWKYGTRFRSREVDDYGRQPESDNWGEVAGSQTLVYYFARKWIRYTVKGPAVVPSIACQTYGAAFVALSMWDPAGLSSYVEAGLRCGAFRVAGHQRVDGIDTIKLTGIVEGKPALTLWVDARTYLPVRMTSGTAVMQFRWLPPTQANLAQLTGTIPPGFHHGPLGK